MAGDRHPASRGILDTRKGGTLIASSCDAAVVH
jgi:hypothetical protein